MRKIFLRWWILCCLIAIGAGGLIWTDFFVYLWNTDLSKLSFIILGMLGICTAYIGNLTYKVSKGKLHHAPHSELKPLWFFSEVMIGLGLAGTLIGFFWVLTNSFEGLDVSNTQDIKMAMQEIGKGVGTAVLTSLVGIVSSILTKFQLVNLEHGRDRKKDGRIRKVQK
jgi:hypothetical protein